MAWRSLAYRASSWEPRLPLPAMRKPGWRRPMSKGRRSAMSTQRRLRTSITDPYTIGMGVLRTTSTIVGTYAMGDTTVLTAMSRRNCGNNACAFGKLPRHTGVASHMAMGRGDRPDARPVPSGCAE